MDSGKSSSSNARRNPIIRSTSTPLRTSTTVPEDGELPLPTTTPTSASRPAAFGQRTDFGWPTLETFIPSFLFDEPIHPRRSKKRSRSTPAHDALQVAPTAWVDGLRGVAALLVLVFHFTYRMTNTNLAYGADDLSESYALWRLPVIRLLSSGSAMVALFFLISGYALSYRPLQLIRAAHATRDTDRERARLKLISHMGSAVLRRPIRLFLPVFISSFFIFLLVRLNVYELTRKTSEDHALFPITPQETHVAYKPSILMQLRHWYTELSDLTHNAFGDNFFGGNFEYDQHMWTIPVELRSSMVLFLALVATAYMRSVRVRVWFWLGILLWSVDGGKWEMLLFYSGALVAEWDLHRLEHGGLLTPASPHGVETASSSTPETLLLTIVSLLILSFPEERAATTPLYHFIAWLTPEWFSQPFRFWQWLGGTALFATIAQSSALKRPLVSAPVQYLGRISYGLYLMHGPVIHTVGFAMLGSWRDEGAGVGVVGYLVSLSVTALAAIWAGDVWWRAVDARCVAWARRFSDAVLVR